MAVAANGYPEHEQDYDLEGEIDYSDIDQRYHVEYDDPLSRSILIDGLPVVPADRVERFYGYFIDRFAATRGFAITRNDIDMPVDDKGSSKGFLFLTLPSEAQAEDASRKLSDAFDKKHTTTCIQLSNIDKLQDVEDEFVEPSSDASAFKPGEHRKGWLADQQSRDQMAILRDDTLQIVWNHKGAKFEVDQERKGWTEAYCQWSPSGTMIATLHRQGVGLWGGPTFGRINRFSHPSTIYIDFSPLERYLITLSMSAIEAVHPFTADNEGHHIAIWDIATGELMRTFPVEATASADGKPVTKGEEKAAKKQIVWPSFKWSADEKYFARVTPGQDICVYAAPSMLLLDRKRIKIDGVVDFEWAPVNDQERADIEEEQRGGALVLEGEAATKGKANGATAPAKPDGKSKKKERDNLLAYWLPESHNQPARVALMELSTRENIRTKNLFNVSECKLYWQDRGDFLCVRADRLTRTKKATGSNLELFRVREKQIPIQVIEIKDEIIEFAWEPKGDRFALITSNDPALGTDTLGATIKTSVSFYQLDPRKGDFIHLKTIEGRTTNKIYWSPRGRHCVFATLGSTSKFEVEFWDVDIDREARQQGAQDSREKESPTGAGVTMLTSLEHYGMTAVQWDPSGRYITLSGSTWHASIEAGYSIYDYRGQEVHKNTPLEKFRQFLWRPRPRTLLPADKQKQILKNLRKYGREFDESDQLEDMNVSSELQAHRRRLIDEWNAWRQRTKEALEQEREEMGREQKALDVAHEAETTTLEEWIEEVVEETTEVVVD